MNFPNLYTALFIILFLTACNGQNNEQIQKVNANTPLIFQRTAKAAKVDTKLEFKEGISSIFEDSKGNFWFGSSKEGVCVYDGTDYTYFTEKEGLCHNQVSQIKEHESGKIIFQTAKGLCVFDGHHFSEFSKPKAKSSFNMLDKMNTASCKKWEKEDGDIWLMGDHLGGVYRYDGQTYNALTIPRMEGDTLPEDTNGYSPYWTFCIYQDRDDEVWFGTVGAGIVHFDGESFDYIRTPNTDVAIRAIFQDKDGKMWFGNNGEGIFTYDGETLINFTEQQGLSHPDFLAGNHKDKPNHLARIFSIGQDDDGNMWFGTADSGLWRYDGKNLKNYTTKDGLPSNFVTQIYKDSTGKMWFGSLINDNGVLYTFDGEAFELIGA